MSDNKPTKRINTRDEETAEIPVIRHSPLPWTLSGPDETKEGKVWRINGRVRLSGFTSAADCRLADIFSIEANAKLMVRAPELFEMLALLADGVECFCIGDKHGDCEWCQAQALLKKIRSGQ